MSSSSEYAPDPVTAALNSLLKRYFTTIFSANSYRILTLYLRVLVKLSMVVFIDHNTKNDNTYNKDLTVMNTYNKDVSIPNDNNC